MLLMSLVSKGGLGMCTNEEQLSEIRQAVADYMRSEGFP